MPVPLEPPATITTTRLLLDRVQPDDLDELFALHSDPQVWTHFPSGRHVHRLTTEQLIDESTLSWDRYGLGYWTVRERPGGAVVGCGGCRAVLEKPRWNLYYRLSPQVHGLGYAAEVGRQAVKAANLIDNQRAVVAIMLEQNHASWRTAERIGLQRVWRGPDEGNPDPDAIRLVYADRPVDDLDQPSAYAD